MTDEELKALVAGNAREIANMKDYQEIESREWRRRMDQIQKTLDQTAAQQEYLTDIMLQDRRDWREQKSKLTEALIVAANLIDSLRATVDAWISSHTRGKESD